MAEFTPETTPVTTPTGTVETPVLGQAITPPVSDTSTQIPVTIPKTTPEVPATTPETVVPTEPTVPSNIPAALQATTTAAISSTGIPPGWNATDYQSNYQAEIDRIKALNPNDPRLPLLESARVTKLSGMSDEQLKAAGVDRYGNPLPPAAQEPFVATGYTLGTLSSKYESSGDPGSVSSGVGDPGGKSYGTYQLSSTRGSLLDFMNSLKTTNPNMYGTLYSAYTKGGVGFGPNFDTAWKQLATTDPNGFAQAQHTYIQSKYYNPAATQLETAGFDISTHSPALQDVLWSVAVQHGVGGAVYLFKKIGFTGSDADIINRLYDERSRVNVYFSASSQAVKNGVYNRFVQERKDALAALQKYPTPEQAPKPTVVDIAPKIAAPPPAVLSAADQATITTLGTQYNTAHAAGDTAGMIDAMKKADAIRVAAGLPAQNSDHITSLGGTPDAIVPPALQPGDIASTRNLPMATTLPTGQVALVDALRNKNIEVGWDASNGNVLVNGEPLKISDIPGASIFEGHVYVTQKAANALVEKYQGTISPPLDTKDFPSTDTAPEGQVELRTALEGQGLTIAWDANAGTISVNGMLMSREDLPNATVYQGHLYVTPDIAQTISLKYGVSGQATKQAYDQQKVLADIQTHQSVRKIQAYYAAKGLTGGGQKAAAIKQLSKQAKTESYQLELNKKAAVDKLVQEGKDASAPTVHDQITAWNTSYDTMLATIARAGEQPEQTYDYLINNAADMIKSIGPTNYKSMINSLADKVNNQYNKWETAYAKMVAAIARAGESPQQTYSYLANNADAVINTIGPTNYRLMLTSLSTELSKAK